MDESSHLIILRGNSGSGKTTTAKELQKKFGHGTMLISQDVVRREMLYVKDGLDTAAAQLLLELALYGKKHCSIIILEGILNSKWYYRLFENLKKNLMAKFQHIILTFLLKKHYPGTSINLMRMNLAKRRCEDGGLMQIF